MIAHARAPPPSFPGTSATRGRLGSRTPPPWLAAKWLFAAVCLNYSSSAFMLLDAAPALAAWRAVHYLPSFLMAAIVVVSRVVPPRRPRRVAAGRE